MKAPYPRRALSRKTYWKGWLEIGVYELEGGAQERFIKLRLPSYGMGYAINWDAMMWGQRVLLYRGHSGFSLHWYFKPGSVPEGFYG